MELEEAIKRLNFDIKKWKIKKQHLDWDISTAKINVHHVAIETVLNHLTKQEKMIELLIEDLQGEGCLNMTREEIDNYYERRIKLAKESE